MARPVKPTGRIIALAALSALAIAAYGIWSAGGFDRDGFLSASRLTARHSFLWFMLVWSASALATLWPGGWRSALLYNRRGVGLGFAAAHLIHAGFFITAIVVYGAPTSPTTLFGGGLGYVFVILMALTSRDYWVKRLTPQGWKLLHTIGAVYIAFIFAFSYYGRLPTKPALAIATLSLMALVIALRVAAWAKKRAPRPA
ncbi:hypothetical protein [Terricaulis sp.]|uniref:hypothetical protein n=1 Tax=Terricaulis sp. TaxID=2768686 RepID=UPI0037837190